MILDFSKPLIKDREYYSFLAVCPICDYPTNNNSAIAYCVANFCFELRYGVLNNLILEVSATEYLFIENTGTYFRNDWTNEKLKISDKNKYSVQEIKDLYHQFKILS